MIQNKKVYKFQKQIDALELIKQIIGPNPERFEKEREAVEILLASFKSYE